VLVAFRGSDGRTPFDEEDVMRQLFVEELKKVEGGAKPEANASSATQRRTTLACCEENGICCF